VEVIVVADNHNMEILYDSGYNCNVVNLGEILRMGDEKILT
jgi:hypothetical protein